MKVATEIHALSQEILDLFDPHRIKQKQINNLDAGVIPADSKWEKIEKEINKEEKLSDLN